MREGKFQQPKIIPPNSTRLAGYLYEKKRLKRGFERK